MRLRACFLVLLSLGILQSCKNATANSADNKSELTILYIGDERIFFQDYWGMEASFLMFLPLAKKVGDQDGQQWEPMLAERWEHSDDYREWTYYLRDDLSWHDGTPVTAADIVYTVNLRNEAAGLSAENAPYQVVMPDQHTVKFIYRDPTEGPESYDVYYPKHLIKDLDLSDVFNWDFWKEPVGNGPYRYVRHVPQTMVEVIKDPAYPIRNMAVESIILKFAQEMSLTELLSGNVDIITYANRDMILKIEGDDRFDAYSWYAQYYTSVYWNHENPLFIKPEIRRALTMAIDRNELAAVLNYPEDLPIYDVILPSMPISKATPSIPHDPEAALEILRDSGWEMNADNLLERDGVPFRFNILLQPDREAEAIFLQDQLRRIGVEMQIQVLESSVFRRRFFTGDFEAAIWRASITPSQNERVNHYSVYGKNSFIGFKNDTLDSLLSIANRTADPKMLKELYAQISPLFSKEIPVTFLLPEVQTHIVRSYIKGLESPYFANPVYNIDRIRLENTP